MTDREMIEQMARIICGNYNNGGCEVDGFVCNYKCTSHEEAERLYNAGYRKIPDGAVVLTKDELEKERELNRKIDLDFAISQFNVQVKSAIEKSIKETAREILKELITNCQYTFNSVGKPIIALSGDFALNVSKRYGVDLEG